MSESASSADKESAAYWSRLMHIGAHEGAVASRPELGELGIDEVHRICNRAWAYSRADFEPSISVEIKNSQWRETCALAGSMAESLMLSAATYIEAVWHSRAIVAGTEPAGMVIAQRYLSDTAIDTVASVGHRLINFVARVARTDLDTRVKLDGVKRFHLLGSSYVPFVTEVDDAWLSLNKGNVDALRNVIPDVHRGSLNALDALVYSPAWGSVFQIRAENFHRWRKEHESVAGVDQHSGNAEDVYNELGNHVGRRVYGRARRHTISDGLTDRTTEAAGNGLRAASEALDAVITDTLNCLPGLTGGFTLDIDPDGRIRKSPPR